MLRIRKQQTIPPKSKGIKGKLQKVPGQVVVEYVLLLFVVVMMAMMVIRILAQRSEDVEESGAIFRQWFQIQKGIGKDLPEKN